MFLTIIAVSSSSSINSYPVNTIFFRIILSGSMLLKEPTAAIAGAALPSALFKTINGRGGNEIGA